MPIELSTEIINCISLLTYCTSGSIEDSIEEVTADHPEVISIMKDTMKMTKDMNFEQPYEKQAEILAEVLDEVRHQGCSFLSLILTATENVNLVYV